MNNLLKTSLKWLTERFPSGQQKVEEAEKQNGKRLYGARRDADMLQKKKKSCSKTTKLQRDQEALPSGAHNEDPLCYM